MPTSVELIGRDPTTGRVVRVEVVDGRIVSIGEGPAGVECWLSPGLVDLQVNGFGGLDVNGRDVTADTIAALTRRLARAGTTTYLPTVVTAAEGDMIRSLQAIAEARRRDTLTAQAVPYIHVEGPHLCAESGPRGIHPPEHIRPPDLDELERWQRASRELVGMVTMSPHFPGSSEYVAAATAKGIRVAIGHTGADPEQVHAAVDAGAVLSTHLGNGAHATLPRHPNYLWTQLAEDRLTATFIADGHHLDADTLRAMLKAKRLERSILVSDSVALAGMPAGRYDAPVGGQVELTEDGRLSHLGTPFLAGAARPLADGVAAAVRLAGLGLGEALGLATSSPGWFAGGRGRLRVGDPAEIVVFDWQPGDSTLTFRQVVSGRSMVTP